MNNFSKHKQSLFIYDRKEMVVLSLLVVMISFFTFTLGVHLGKRLTTRGSTLEKDVSLVRSLPDSLANSQDLLKTGKRCPSCH